MKCAYRLLLLAVVLFLPVHTFASSEVILKNGDRVSGSIVEESEDTLVLDTEYAGRIRIARKHIEKIAGQPSGSSTPKTRTGPSADLAADPVRTAAAKPAQPAVAPKKRLFGGRHMGLTDGWDGNANIGFSFTSGNSNTTTMTTGLRAVKSGGRDNLTIYVRSLWNSNHGSGRIVTTQNAFWGGARYDRNASRRTFGFVSYDFERDRPKKLNFRSVVGGGVGYHAIKNDRTEIDLLGGSAWNRTWQPGDNTDTPEGLVGTTVKHKFHDRLRFQNTFTYFKNLTRAAEYRMLFDATISADVTKRVGFFVTLGDRFNSDPIGASKRNDLLFTTGMKWSFGKKK